MIKATHYKGVHRVLTVERRSDAATRQAAGDIARTTVQLRKATGGASVLDSLGDEGERVKVAALQVLQRTDYTHGRGTGAASPTVPLEIERAAILEVAGGANPRQVEVKYDIAVGYVTHAMKRRFGSPEAAKLALQGLVLEGALACNVHALTKVQDMSGPQAVMSGAILIDKALALEKSIADKPKSIDFGQLAEVAKTLKVLREIAAKPLRQTDE